MGEHIYIITIALLGGVVLGVNRSLLGKLGIEVGAASASVINHVGGAIFIFLVLLVTGGRIEFSLFSEAPTHAYVGGIIGALFVALVSWLIPKIGVMKTTVLLIAGQMLMSTLLDYLLGRVQSIPVALGGLVLIICGVLVGEYRKKKS